MRPAGNCLMAEDREAEEGTAPAEAMPSEGASPAPPPAPEGLGSRLTRMRRARGAPMGRRGLGGNGPLLGGAAFAVAVAGGVYLIASASQRPEDEGLTASEVEAFQSAGGTGGRILFPEDEPAPQAPAPRIEMPAAQEDEPAPTPAAARPEDGVASEIAELRRSLRESEAAREAEARARDEAAAQAVQEARRLFDEQQTELADRLDAVEEEAAAARGEADDLQASLDAERSARRALEAQLAQEEEDLVAQAAEDERRRAREEEERLRRVEAGELRERQVLSPAVVFAEGPGRGGGAGAGDRGASPADADATAGAGQGGPQLTDAEAYLASAPPLVVQEAERMTDPDRTLAQGSVIQAVLQGAVSSELPGNVVAVVSEPVPAFSGDAVLVPRGSRLFGSYRAGMEAGQRRVLIRWSRILTPDGTSMEISAVGGDGLGRSGLSGFVDRRLRERLGTAALISVITAAPALAASGGGAGTDLVLDTGDDLGGQASSALEDQLAIPPTIHVPQGAAVTVIVDRDIVVR